MTDDTQPITQTVELDPSAFDESRQLMYGRPVEQYGRETVAEQLPANRSQNLTVGMQLVNTLWDNREGIQVDPDAIETPQVPD